MVTSLCCHNMALLGLYEPVLLPLLGITGVYGPSCHTKIENQSFQYSNIPRFQYSNVFIVTHVGMCLGVWPGPLGSALGISYVLGLYFIVYPSSCHGTDTIGINFPFT